MPIYKTDNRPFEGPHVLDNPPPFHEKLCDYGERPYWSPDGSKIAFIENNYGDICEMDFATRKVRNLTKCLGVQHSVLSVFLLRGRTMHAHYHLHIVQLARRDSLFADL